MLYIVQSWNQKILMCKKHADQKWRDDPLCCKEGLRQWKIACVIHFTVDFSPPPTGNLVSECSAVTTREKSLYRKTRWRTLTETEEMASDLTVRCKRLKGTERDGWELWVRKGKGLVLLVYLQDMLSCASFGLKSGFFPFVHHKVKEGLCFLTSCSRRSRSDRAFSRADWTSVSLDSRDCTNRETHTYSILRSILNIN